MIVSSDYPISIVVAPSLSPVPDIGSGQAKGKKEPSYTRTHEAQ